MPLSFHIPFPSIHHVLETGADEPMLPRRPSVITIVDTDEGDYAASWTPTGTLVSAPSNATSTSLSSASTGGRPSPGHRDLMQTIDLRDAEPIARQGEEQFSFIVHFPDEDEIDNDDTATIFEERPRTSRGLPHHKCFSASSTDVKIQSQKIAELLVTAMRKLQFKLPPVKMNMSMNKKMPRPAGAGAFGRKIVQH
ncbi:hypothetical protein CVT26_005989 [Gymnopilus dilepis]|uniref:Uncharacterized protein n=1 Tax=Gymnopilus dilepis TaxID=231916 RepID=A0A409WFL6_9AGAR|nr:hypothetical protein CVT26_005989 [Gymnopilus dilepis]